MDHVDRASLVQFNAHLGNRFHFAYSTLHASRRSDLKYEVDESDSQLGEQTTTCPFVYNR